MCVEEYFRPVAKSRAGYKKEGTMAEQHGQGGDASERLEFGNVSVARLHDLSRAKLEKGDRL
jgi:hypothetical protein